MNLISILFTVNINGVKMNFDKPKESSDVQLISENEAVRPGSTKIKNIHKDKKYQYQTDHGK